MEKISFKRTALLLFLIPILLFQSGCNKEAAPDDVIVLPGVTIGSQTWTLFNLDVTTYRNGNDIPEVKDPATWVTLTTGAWCWYNNDSATYAVVYGRLYNWFAVNDPRGLAPAGYHIPAEAEMTRLTDTLGGLTMAGGKMKSTTLWNLPNTGATNSSGFTALPGGYRNGIGSFNSLGDNGFFWTSTADGAADAWGRRLDYNNVVVVTGVPNKVYGFSVRCVKD